MIVALEGPDRSGKTTLLEPLAEALRTPYITRKWVDVDVLPYVHLMEPKYLQLFGELYDEHSIYVCDRSPTVSAQVYSSVFQRPCMIDWRPWVERQVIVYVDTPIDVLRKRHLATGDDAFPMEMYERVIAEYQRVLRDYTVLRVDGRWTVEMSVNSICLSLDGLVRNGSFR